MRHPAVPFVFPFLAFVGLLILQWAVQVPPWLRFIALMAAILTVSRTPLRGRLSKPFASVLIGIAVFVVWVGPDRITPNWHHFFLFDNPIMGHPAGNTAPASQTDPLFLSFRVAISVIAVPILEELFWRGWLMRWLINAEHFEQTPLGTWAPAAFWITALLFASEHGSFWDVGLAAGIVYNWWMIRTRSLWDCILAHAVTNALLAGYVIAAGQWQYWL